MFKVLRFFVFVNRQVDAVESPGGLPQARIALEGVLGKRQRPPAHN